MTDWGRVEQGKYYDRRCLEKEIEIYRQMLDSTPMGKWATRRLLSSKLDKLLVDLSSKYGIKVERTFEGFSYAHFLNAEGCNRLHGEEI